MASFNKVILVGNLTRDPQVKYTAGGMAVTEIGLAVNHQWFDKQSNTRKEEVTFVDVTLWGRTAEVAGEYLAKGKQVLIEGRLKLDTWDDKATGQKRSKLHVVGENMTMLGSRGDGGPQSSGSQNSGTGSRSSAPASRGSEGDAGQSSHENTTYSQEGGGYENHDEPSGGPPADEVPF